MKAIKPMLVILTILIFPTIFADDEASNIPYVKSGTWGRVYAKAVPEEYYGQKGITTIYLVSDKADKKLYSFDWYASQIFLQGNLFDGKQSGVSVVRCGPWARGRYATKNDLAFEFYFNESLLKRYSTLDIAGSKNNGEASVSHYQVIKEYTGYRWLHDNTYVFEVITIDGRKLSFDVSTGKRITE